MKPISGGQQQKKNGTGTGTATGLGEDPKVWATFKEIIESADKRRYQWAKLNQNKFIEEAKKVRETQ